ncbi:MAG TPA: hypothetical protein DEP38_05750 [Cyanobacteria bacterium UBA9226]|nr:hypothetical protein [Cyanobacteria bacterium UBA9226]
MLWKVLVSMVVVGSVGFGFSGLGWADTSVDAMVRQVVSEKPEESESAIASLRHEGEKGWAEVLAVYGKELDNPKIRLVLDRICQQRDCYASQLFWYTDLEEAKAAAKASGKPILSLRLLGNLDRDLSCANSRFFRVVLYPNTEVSQVLRDKFILHWESVRPVPKVTIDFGDGRQLERTITGNSIHYILDGDGRIIDALPGLYGPQAFLRELAQAETATKETNKLPAGERDNYLRQYYRDRLATIQANWKQDLSTLGITPPNQLLEIPSNIPTAAEASQRAISKMYVENPLLTAITGNQTTLTNATNETAWTKLAQLHNQDAKIDNNSQNLMRNKNPQAYNITGKNITPGSPQDPLVSIINKFQSLIALDTVKNQYLLQPQIYTWLLELPNQNINNFNELVYTQLFLTPSTDPWLGLLPSDSYSAIENEGITQ